MAKGDLFSIKTQFGYGLFQEFDSHLEMYGPYFIVYYSQIKSLTVDEIARTMQGEYYYQRIALRFALKCDFDYEYILKILKSLKKARLLETLEVHREW